MAYHHFSALLAQTLLRMRRAAHRGTGCRLTPEMVGALDCTVIAEWWGEPELEQQALQNSTNTDVEAQDG